MSEVTGLPEKPLSRTETYLASIAGEEVELPDKPLSRVEQYLEYIHQLEHEDLEDAADFLEMAARLIYIKTVSLLPHDEEAQELKKELEGRLRAANTHARLGTASTPAIPRSC